jgi:hypothetical protein
MMRPLDGNCRGFGLPGRVRVSVYRRTICEREQDFMAHQANHHIASPSIAWRVKQAHNVISVLWLRICAGFAAYRRRRAAAVLYAELSKLSDADLRCRGLAREDLHRLASDISET